MKKHSIRILFIILFTLCILPVSSVMLISACRAVAPASAKSDTISVTYRFDESEILNWLDTKQFTKNLRVLSLPGEPLALYRVANILLPPYTEAADVSVVGKIGGQHIVRDIPCGQPPTIIGEKPTIVGKNANIYNSDELYPKEIYRVGSVKSFRGYNILNVRLYPVQYKPASKLALYYEEMIVQVKLKEGSTIDTLRNLVKGHEAVETLVDNPLVLSTYDSTLDTADSTLITTETLGTTYEYIIVTTPDLADEFQVLADWKAMFVDGAKVVTVNVDANETEIKNVINDYYTNYNTSYVLLGGDVGVITYHTKTVMGTPIAEDYWYANLVGDDDISYYEVYIGRAPVDTEEETENFVNKVMAYEQMDKPKANLFHQSRVRAGNDPDSRELAWQCEQYVPPDYTNYELFEENGKIEKTDWINFWRNDGIMNEHIGHGSQTFYDINYEVDGEVKWYNTDVASMNNTFWPVHTSVACFSGAFEYEDSLAEAYVKDSDNGAIACLFNDKQGWYHASDATMLSGDFIEMQFKALYQDGWTSIGAMLAHSKHYFIDEANNSPDKEYWEWCYREINLIGDPETPLLTTRAQTVNVVKNSGWETGNNSYWNVSTTMEPDSSVDYEVNQDSACNGTYGFHVSMETDNNKPLYTTQSLMEYQSVSHAMLDTRTKLKYRIYPAYELHGVSEIPQARWETILSFSTGKKLHYYSSLNMEPTENSTDKYVYMPINLNQWNEFFDKKVLETYTSNFGTPPIGTVITKIAAFVTSETYAERRNKFNRVIANFDSDEDTEGLQCTIWYVKNLDTGLNYTSIQEAIDAPATLGGHTISVMGPFYEHVVLNKSLTVKGLQPSTTIIDGNGTGNVVNVQANNVTISRFRIQNGQYGIRLDSNNTIISSNTVSNNGYYGIFLENCKNTSVIDNTVTNSDQTAVYLIYCNNVSVSGNTVSNNTGNGIFLYRSINAIVSSNMISNNTHFISAIGIMINNNMPGLGVGNNTVVGNIVVDNYEGIRVHSSRDNIIIGNIVANNTHDGIYLESSRYNSITENWVSNNGMGYYWGIHLWASLYNIIYHNNFINNTNQARAVTSLPNTWDDGYPSGGNYWSDYTGSDANGDGIGDTPYVIAGESNQDNYPLTRPWGSIRNVDTDRIYLTIQKAIDAYETLNGHTIEVKADTYYENVVVDKSLTIIGEDPSTTIIDGGGGGMFGEDVVTLELGNVSVSGFTIQNGRYGVYPYLCIYGNTISGNTISNNFIGVYLDQYTEDNTVSNNIVSNNDIGILVEFSDGNTVSGNTLLNDGIVLGGSDGNTVSDNIVSNGDNIYLTNSDGNTVRGNNVTGSSYGIYLEQSSGNTVSDNIVSSNSNRGIYLTGSNSNTINDNKISNNDYGIYLYSSSGNVIHHNRFINNTIQAAGIGGTNVWDDGYPSGGNYWSDYNGTDLYSGPYQNETGSDGIGDTPYIIDENNQDNYPVLQPWNLVENIDTGLTYSTIQGAIDAPETLNGHTIQVYLGTYREEVVVSKSLTVKGLHPSTTIINGQDTYYDTGFLIYANDTTITGFASERYDIGIEIWGSNCNVSGNAFGYNYDYHIYVEEGCNNTISNNDISTWGGKYGVYLKYSDNNTISGNTVVGKFIGIYMLYSNQNTIKNNTFSYCTIGPVSQHSGMYIRESNNNTISDNTITNNEDYGIFLLGDDNTVSDNTISDNEYVGILVGGDDNSISGNTISDNWYDGIFVNGDNNTISGNTITNNGGKGVYVDCGEGIYVGGSYNSVSGNTLSNNIYGIWLQVSNNVIYHNNFIDNTNQTYVRSGKTNVWDDGYPSGGNYWSDYNGTDLYSGPYQNETGSDGIGDTPYIIDENNQDNYPLIRPWGSIRNVDTDRIYLTIQKAIDASETSDGDTIEVKAGTYYEEVVVDKSLTLVGEDASNTIIDGGGTDNVVTVQANNVRISQFTIQNGTTGIYLESSNNTSVSGNMVLDNNYGILVYHNSNNNSISGNTAPTIAVHNASNNNVISGNTVLYNNHYFAGILLHLSNYNTVCDNTVLNFDIWYGIYLRNAIGNSVTDNTISNNTHGINLYESSNNTISGNTISNNYYGIYLGNSIDNIIHHNNFINNTDHVAWGSSNTWNSINLVGNYWDNYWGEDQNGDGIGDTLLPHLEVDWYPLMWKWFPGDLDGDGYVGSNDLAIFSDAYGSQMGDPNYNPIADLDYDGDVDVDDLFIFSGNYGKSDP